jgi:mannonate dehydratase
MKIGERLVLGSSLTDDNMTYLKQLGVNQLMVMTQEMGGIAPAGQAAVAAGLVQGDYYVYADLMALKKWVEGHGLELFAIIQTPFNRWDKIILGRPGRDAQIENWCVSLRNLGRAGIPMLQYSWVINAGAWLPLWRTTSEKAGRGGAQIVRFDYDIARQTGLTEFGELGEELLWDNLTYFLKAVIPVAEASGVKMMMHPADPQVPALAGIARIIRSIEAYDRLFNIADSAANSMVLCLGCLSQIMAPEGVYRAIRSFARRDKIGYVDFRNVRGSLTKFDEVYPDEGKLDMVKAIKTLQQTGFTGRIVPDHAPHTIGDSPYGHISHAFQIGYLKGLLQSAGLPGVSK